MMTKVTFKQKVGWVNEVGLGGGLVWASDQGERISSL
jgi:GH18 family chitinase